MNKYEYKARLNSLNERVKTTCNFFELSDLVTEYQMLLEELVKDKEVRCTQMNYAELNMKVPIIPDQDVALVKEFIVSLDKVANEMELLEEDEYSGTVLSVKLKRVYDEYKDKVMPSSSFESFIDYYSYLQSKKEEERKEKANKDYHEKLLAIKKENKKKLNDLYEEYREVLGFNLKEYREKIGNK